MNYFQVDLNDSMKWSRDGIFSSSYAYFFPTMYSSSLCDSNMTLQRQGVDRKIFLRNTKVILIDEKVRRKWYNDILLEEFSSDNQSLGWIEKDLLIDYIAYLIPSVGKCFLLPFIQTQNAWRKNKDKWKVIYRRIVAHNDGYNTISWAIPVEILYGAIAREYLAEII